jgi:ABC-2 type transport system permease protein
MTASAETPGSLVPPSHGGLWWSLRDGVTIWRRDLLHLKHNPLEIASNLIFPIFTVILFGYVFGSAIKVPGGGSYRSYLMPGLFAMSQVSAMGTLALVTADDAAKGIMDRFRSMPMARLAVPFGRTLADMVSGILSIAGMAAVGLIVGWRIDNGVPDAIAAFALLLLFRYALGWLGAYLGLLIKNPNTADALVPLTFPVSMIANTFVSPAGMPVWLRVVAYWNPISALVASLRYLFGNPGAVTPSPPLPLQHPILTTLAWCALFLAVFVPLATYRYTHRGR